MYREFNADADGVANEALDRYRRSLHIDGIVVNDNWSPCVVSPSDKIGLRNATGQDMSRQQRLQPTGRQDDDDLNSDALRVTSDDTDAEMAMNHHLSRWD